MRIPDSVLAQISERLDVAQVVSEYVALQKRGGRYWGLCPFHAEKTPSFSVNPDKAMFYCFGCHKGGSIFTFIMEIEKLSFVEAVQLLAKKVGVEIVLEGEDNRGRDAAVELYRRVAGTFHYLLLHQPEAEAARRYLAGRSVSAEAVERFQIGYAPADGQWLAKFLQDKSYSADFLRASGLFGAPRPAGGAGRLTALFRGRIVFPIHNHRGEVVGFGGRALRTEAGPKYLNSPENDVFRKRENLFGAPEVYQAMRREGRFVLAEGYMDVLALWQAGFQTAVAPLGTSITEEQVRLLKRYASSGLLVFDTDEAGRRATERALLMCEQQDLDVEIVQPGAGGAASDAGGAASDAGGAASAKDPAEILEKLGPEGLQKALEYHITGFQFYLKTARANHDPRTPEGKRGIIRHLSPFLKSVDSQVKRDGYFRLLAEAVGVDFESVRSDFLRGSGGSKATLTTSRLRQAQGSGAELFLMLAVAANRELFAQLRNMLSVDDLEEGQARALFVALEECYRNGEGSPEALLQRIGDEALRRLVIEKTASGEFAVNAEQMIRDGLRAVRRRGLEKRRRAVSSAVARSAGLDPARLKELLAEKMYLDEELERLKVSTDDRPAE